MLYYCVHVAEIKKGLKAMRLHLKILEKGKQLKPKKKKKKIMNIIVEIHEIENGK